MKKGTEFAVAAFFFLMIPVAAYGFDVPSVEPISELIKLIFSWKTIGAAAAGVSIVLILMEVLKRYFPTFRYLEVAAVVLSIAYTVLVAMVGGSGLAESLFTVLISGRGAMLLYDAIKKAIENKAAVVVPFPPKVEA